MPVIDFNPDVLDKAYQRETANKQPTELTSHSRKWHNAILRLLHLETLEPSEHSRRRIEALEQVYMFYLIRHSYTNESLMG